MGTRLEFQTLLEDLLTSLTLLTSPSNVYFQPPENVTITYPCIVYNRYFEVAAFADNQPYSRTKRYRVTVIDKNPDSAIPDKVAELPLTTFVRHFTVDNLNHDIFDVYF